MTEGSGNQLILITFLVLHYTYHSQYNLDPECATNVNNVGFYVLKAVTIETVEVRDITPCSQVRVNRRFSGTYHLHLQDRRINQYNTSMKVSASRAGFLLDLLFDPDGGGGMFLRNVCLLSPD
jgi:hypothetical protein